jgi:alpha-L-fucosidase
MKTSNRSLGIRTIFPLFTAEKFDAGEWADIFATSWAKFAGPVAEHHDGFAMKRRRGIQFIE